MPSNNRLITPTPRWLPLAVFLYTLLGFGLPGRAEETASLPTTVVCLGDSITDGNTYPLILMQSFHETGGPVPAFICSGVGGDSAKTMDARFEKTVVIFKPQLVTVNAGTNDAAQHVSAEDYGKAIRSIVAKAKAIGARVMLVTPSECLARNGKTEVEKEENFKKTQTHLDSYEAVLRTIAAEDSCLLAENRKLMKEAIASGKSLFVEDNTHPNYLGQSIIARSILDALGRGSVALPPKFDPQPLPGLIGNWMLRRTPLDTKGQPVLLTPSMVSELVPDATWTSWALPEKDPLADSPGMWVEQMRRNGTVQKTERFLGKGKFIQGVAEITSTDGGEAFIQTGMGIQTVWLNGTKVHDQMKVWTGAHVGKERIPVSLAKGNNTIVIEASESFVLSVTPRLIWEDRIY